MAPLLLLAAAAIVGAALGCTPPGARATGEPGFPAVPYLGPCCDGTPFVARAGTWGTFCADADCYPPGARAIGAPGFPGVPYLPCCSGAAPVGRADDWGQFCPAAGAPAPAPAPQGADCYPPGERNQGAEGFPPVPYAPCCDGAAPVDAPPGDFGKFCPPLGGEQPPDCYKVGERAIGAPGFPEVKYAPCCDGAQPRLLVDDWGRFCPPPDVDVPVTVPPVAPIPVLSCYPPGDRAIGAPGFPEVKYLRCCDGGDPVPRSNDWGLFCPGGSPEPQSPAPTAPPVVVVPSPPDVGGTGTAGPWTRAEGSTGDNFYGLAYSPFGGGSDNAVCAPFVGANGGDNFCLGPDRVATDLEILASMTRRIRTYSINPCKANVEQILTFARANGMKVQLGVWVDNNLGADQAEIAQLQDIASRYKDVIQEVVLGNEVVFIVGATTQYLAARLREARQALLNAEAGQLPLGTAEVWDIWWDDPGAQEIVDECDFLGLQLHTYYTQTDPFVSDVGKMAVDPAFSIQAKFDKPVIVAETGYPSGGPINGDAAPSVGRLERAALDIEIWSRLRNVPIYFFEAFDADWKRRWIPSFSGIDYFFGLRDCAREPKNIQLPPGGAI